MRFTLRAYLEAGMAPREALQVAGPVISHHLDDGVFATAVIAVHDPETSSLVYACAGHPPPLVVGPERPEAILAASSPPIGLDLKTGLRQTTLPLRPGAVICLYTDGLAEARKATRILGRPRIGDFVEQLGPTAPASELLERVAAAARIVTDDMAAVLIRPTGAAGEAGVRHEQLEVDPDDAASGIAEQFLAACHVGEAERPWLAAEAGRIAREHGTAVLDVAFAAPRPVAAVLPGNVVSIGAAAARPATVGHWPPPSLRRGGRLALSGVGADLDEHLADVVAAQQADEGVRHVLDPVDDRLAVAQLAVADPAADLVDELAHAGRSGRATMKPRSVSRLPTISEPRLRGPGGGSVAL